MDNKAVKKLSTTNLILIASVVGVIMLIALVFVGRIMVKKITLNGKIIAKKTTANNQLKANIAALPGLTQSYQNLGGVTSAINDSLPTTADFPSIVATMEGIAGSSGVELDNVTPTNGTAGIAGSTVTPPTNLTPSQAVSNIQGTSATSSGSSQVSAPSQYQYSISVKGSYAQIMSLLKNLQLSSRPITFSGLSITGSDTNALTAQLSLTTYYYDPPVLQDKTETVK